MTYQPGIPNPGDFLSTSQGQLKNNFTALNTLFGIDHTPFATAANGGYHKQVHLLNESAPGIGSANGVLFSNTDASTNSWPFWQNSSGFFQMMGTNLPTLNNGQVFLPGGIIMKWGQVVQTFPANKTTGMTSFTPNFPNVCYNVQITPTNASGSRPSSQSVIAISVESLATNQFTWLANSVSGSYTGFYWIAIGN